LTEWESVRLGEALSVSHGFAFRGEFFREEGDLIILTPGNFREAGGFKQKSGKEKYYTGSFPNEFLLAKSQVVVAMTEQSKGLLGSSATIPDDNKYLHNQRIGLMHIEDPRRLDLRFAYHLLNAPYVRQQIQATATGSKVRHTAPKRIEAIVALLPNIRFQRQIAYALDSLEDLIENNRRRIEILEEIARLLYREWFVHFRFPGHEDVDMVDSVLGPIPEGWDVHSFSDLAAFVNGFAFKPDHWLDEGLPIIKIKELKNGVTTDTPRYDGADIGDKYFIDNGAVLFSWSADLKAYVWAHGPALLNQHLFDVRPNEVSRLFIFHALNGRMDEFQARAQGTTMKHIKRSALREVRVALPPVELRDEFESMARPMLDLQLILSSQTQALREARDLLLPRLVSGELDVSELDLDLVPV